MGPDEISPLERAMEKPGSETCEVMMAWIKRHALRGMVDMNLDEEEHTTSRM